jgi:thioredoxin-related protein
MKQLIALAIVFSTLTALSAQGIAFEDHDAKWADILKKAKTENKIVFVDAYTTWCGPCKTMSKNIFPQKEVGDLFNAKFVNAKIDMENGEGPEIAKKYAIQAYPTYLFINGDGELVHRGLGAMPADKFLAVGESAADPEKQFFSLKKKYEKGDRGADFLRNFANSCQDAQETTLIPAVADAYLATQKDWLTSDNMDFILKFTTSIESPTFGYLMKNQVAFNKIKGEKVINEKIEQIAINGVANASFNREKREFDFDKARKAGSKYLSQEMSDKIISTLTLAQYQMKGEVASVLTYAITHFDRYPSKNSQELNQYAWSFYEQSNDKTQLQKALEWSLKSVEIDDIYAFNDTAASLYFKLGNKQKAKEFAEKAIKMGKTAGENVADTEALLKKIEAM